MLLPKKISPCPIAETICEVRFDPNFPDDAIFGIVYNAFRDEYEAFEKLPILQIPEQLRSIDPNFIFRPHYKSTKNQFQMQIGPHVFSCINVGQYVGWDKFSEYIYTTFDKFEKLQIIKSIVRVGLRYVNVFSELEIYSKSNFQILLDGLPLDSSKSAIYFELKKETCVLNLRVLNNSNIEIAGKTIAGSVIDIDTVLSIFPSDSLEKLKPLIKSSHECEKQLFLNCYQTSLYNH